MIKQMAGLRLCRILTMQGSSQDWETLEVGICKDQPCPEPTVIETVANSVT